MTKFGAFLPRAIVFLAMLAICGAFGSSRAVAMAAAAPLTDELAGAPAVERVEWRAQTLPLQAKMIVNESEMTEDRQLGGSHLVPGILLSIGLLLGGGWLFGSGIALSFQKDPLTARVRNQLDRLDATRLTVRNLAFGAIAGHDDKELFDVRALHDTIAERADALLDKAKADFCLDVVDESYFAAEIDDIIAQCKVLLEKLAPLQPQRGPAAKAAGAWNNAPNAVARAKRGWDRVFAKDGELKMTTISQLNQMKWPLWSALKWMSGGTPQR